jgi:uncharacterized ion transporter superfamily protein YfcC
MAGNTKDGINMAKPKKKFSTPHSLVIIILLLFISMILTWIVPAGTFERVVNPTTGNKVVDPNTFHYIKQCGQNIFDMLNAVPAGFTGAATIIGMLTICGATMQVINGTGAIDSALGIAVKKMQGSKRYWLIFGLMLVGVVLGLRGAAETLLLYLPIYISTCIALGYDSITGFACIMISGALGFATSWMGTNYMVSAGIAELNPLMQDVWFRCIVVSLALVILFVYLRIYMHKIEKDPKQSPQYESDKTLDLTMDMKEVKEFTVRRKIIFILFAFSIVMMIVGAIVFGWKMANFTAFYFALSLVVALIWGYTPNDFAKEFINGAKSMVFPVVASL